MSACEDIYDWTPDNEDLYKVRWIDRPMWPLDFLPLDLTELDRMTSREIQKSGQLVIQCAFLAATLRSWAWLDAREKKQTEQEVEEMANIYERCQRLYLYIHWKEDVVNKSWLAQWFHFCVRLDMSGM